MIGIDRYLAQYQTLLREYAEKPSEILRYECSELGKTLAINQFSTEDMIALHERAISAEYANLTKQQIIVTFDLLAEISVQQTLWLKREMELKALAEAEISRKALIEKSIISCFPDILIKLSIDLDIIDKNLLFDEVFSGTRLETKSDLFELFDSKQDFINLKEYTHKTGRRSRLKTSLKCKSGKTIPCEVTVVLLDNAEGTAAAFLCIIRDLSEQVEITTKLAVAEQMVYDVIEAMPLRIYWKDVDLKYLGCNSAYLEDIGLDAERNIVGKCGDDLSDFAQQFSIIPQERKVLEQKVMYSQCERVIKSSSQTMDVRQTIPPLRGISGDIYGIICCYEDISQLKSQEKENKRLADHLQQSERLDSIGRLAGGIAHDFNNMLSVILGYSQMIERKVPVHRDDKLLEYVGRISGAAQKAKLLTEKLLTFSRKKETNPVPIELHQHFKNAITTYSSIINEEVVISLVTDQPQWVLADTSQLDQVILNLLVNANDAMNECGDAVQKRIDITLNRIPEQHAVRIIVKDCGIGIPADIQNKIFDPFFTTKAGIGTGLGLSTILGIVVQNNAYIGVDSELGKGTSIHIDWPLTDIAPSEYSLTSDPTIPLVINQREQHSVICVVEDEQPVRDLIHAVLSDIGHQVHTFENSNALFTTLERDNIRPHLLISDVVLANGENGIDVSEQFMARFPDAQRLLMSGYSNDLLSQRGKLVKDCIDITKPFEFEHFISVVNSAIAKL